MDEPDLFPLGVATGIAHCNREAERAELVRNVLKGRHTWLWGRRRMGKTSLLEQMIEDLGRARRKVPVATVDLFVAHDARNVESDLLKAVARLGVELAPRGRSAAQRLGEAFSSFMPEFAVGAPGLSMKLKPLGQSGRGVAEALAGLDRAAGLYDRRAVLVLDEFQQIGSMQEGRSLEGAIRHAVERFRHVTCLFSGSQRHLLASMFDEEDRPLFRLCRKMTLGRIESADYRNFMREASERRWSAVLADPVIERILAATTRHPYYVNVLCSRLWSGTDAPNVETVDAVWQRIAMEEKPVATSCVARLAASQRALLRAIANAEGGVEQPTAQEFLSPIRIAASTANRAKEVLEQEDLIRREENGRWRLVDPVMDFCLRRLQ